MIAQLKNRKEHSTISTIKVSPEIRQELDRYREFMLAHEYTAQTVTGYCVYLSRFLRGREPSADLNSPLDEKVGAFLKEQCQSSQKTFKECRAALLLYYKMVAGESLKKTGAQQQNPEIEALIQQFYDYLVNVKRIRRSSAERYASEVRSFLGYVAASKDISCLESMTAHDIREFVVKGISHLSDVSKGGVVTAIRNYFRFRKFAGMTVHESIFLIPLSPAVWKKSAFPKTMDESVFDHLHDVPDVRTRTGIRNRAIILCFTELALRCDEVAGLTLDDFQWRDGCVTIRNTKSHSDRKLPVSARLGQAIAEYLSKSRPTTSSRFLFVRFKHVGGEPMGREQIRGVVRRVYAKSGAEIKTTGTHILRRTAGSRIYNSGNSLKTTADILGHESLDSTALYVKADIAGLRQAAAPWPCSSVGGAVGDA
jgi:site-specific recombinase XerD